MNIPRLKVYAALPMGPLDAATIRAGVERRMALLTYLFSPENEEEPELVLERTRYESHGADELLIRWRPRMRYPMRVYRFPEAEAPEQVAMSNFALRNYDEHQSADVRRRLAACRDGIGFWPPASYERDGMGWPLAMAVAAALAKPVGGMIETSEFGWFVPNGNEVRRVPDP